MIVRLSSFFIGHVVCLIDHLPLFFFNDTATTEIYTYGHPLSLHDALPIYHEADASHSRKLPVGHVFAQPRRTYARNGDSGRARLYVEGIRHGPRSEEHTSELQSLMRISYAVFCLQKKIN